MKCEFCQREFKHEKRLESHLCEPKRRYLNKDTKVGQMAFELFSRFKTFHRLKSKKDPFTEFLGSKQYRAFETLAKFFLKTNPLDANEYFDHLIKSSIPFRKWTSDDYYSEWARVKIMEEDPDTAVSRSIQTLVEFAREKGVQVSDVYEHISGNRLCLWLRTGRLSPWFVILSKNPSNILDKLDNEMLSSLEDLINPLYWRHRAQKSAVAGQIQRDLKEANL